MDNLLFIKRRNYIMTKVFALFMLYTYILLSFKVAFEPQIMVNHPFRYLGLAIICTICIGGCIIYDMIKKK